MSVNIVMDSSPLGLLLHNRGYSQSIACRNWLRHKQNEGSSIFLPEIVDYEIRRELIRLKQTNALADLDLFESLMGGRILRLNPESLRLAADLWAKTRAVGKPLADVKALDIDVILAAQVLVSGLDMVQTVVATSNVKHLIHLLPAREWSEI